MDLDIESLYSPLKNYLHKQRLHESLLAIHAHLQFQQFQVPLPNYIIGEPPGYRGITSFFDSLNFHVFPWELALICKEIIINSERYGRTHSLLVWPYLAGTVNNLKDFENELAKRYSTRENVLLEAFRISHRQFRWQRRPTMDEPARYWKLFSYGNLHNLVEKSIGLTIEEIIKIGMSLQGVFQDKIALFYPPQSNVPGINQEKIDKFLEHFCIDFEELRKRLISEQQYNHKFAFAYSSLVAYPLIRTVWNDRDAIICPVPRYLYERITDGLYYEVVRTPGFDRAFGDAFQWYIGEALKALFKKGKIYPETFYDKYKRTADWVAEDGSAILFLECKTKRLAFNAKEALLDLSALETELGKLADAVAQLYTTIEDYKKGSYPQLKYQPNKVIYPMVVTLEEWFIWGNPIVNKLDDLVKERLLKRGLSPDLITTQPYCIGSAETLEWIAYLANVHNLFEVLNEKVTSSDKKYWEIQNYLRKKFSGEIHEIRCPFVPELDTKIEKMLAQRTLSQ